MPQAEKENDSVMHREVPPGYATASKFFVAWGMSDYICNSIILASWMSYFQGKQAVPLHKREPVWG